MRDLERRNESFASDLFVATYPARRHEVASWAGDAAVRHWIVDGDNGAPCGYAALWPVRPGRWRMDLIVAPDRRRRGLGAAALAVLVERARAGDAATLQARTEAHELDALRFLAGHGFVETQRMSRLVLDVAGADVGDIAGDEARLAARGVAIVALDEEPVPGLWERFARVFNAARDGWPDPDPGVDPDPPLTADQLRAHYLRMVATFDSVDRCFLARRGDEYLGFTGVVGTGVDPRVRNQGIATAIKRRAIADARRRGVATIRTSSASPAMLHINQRLGFATVGIEVRLVRRLR